MVTNPFTALYTTLQLNTDFHALTRPPMLYNTEKIQSNEQVFCGHLCIYVLKQATLGRDLQEILNDLH